VFDLSNKVVLLTGGSRGIGAATARAISRQGGRLLLHYAHSASAAESLRAEIGPDRCQLVRADLSERTGAEDLWSTALSLAPRIDVLVNNAAIFEPAPITAPIDQWRKAWDKVLRVNLMAPAELSRFAIEHFRSAGGGKIINVASRAAHRGDAPTEWPYAASKGGLVAMTKTIARAYAADNVLAFAIAPGFTETDMGFAGLDEAGVKRIVSEIPLGSMVRPEECGALAAFLCSDVVRHMTGATFDINGASYVR
jgi:3-oxoacyl-[acyl-carrier protein] reductase